MYSILSNGLLRYLISELHVKGHLRIRIEKFCCTRILAPSMYLTTMIRNVGMNCVYHWNPSDAVILYTEYNKMKECELGARRQNGS